MGTASDRGGRRLAAGLCIAGPVLAQKTGGTLQMLDFASPASMSIHEESTITAGIPMMGVFNNLVVFDQHVPQNSLDSIVPDLATELALERGRQGADLSSCATASSGMTASRSPRPMSNAPGTGFAGLTPTSSASIRARRGIATSTKSRPTATIEVTFHLKRPQPYLIALLASGQSPVYPCHVSTAQMRTHPIGTGPFKFVEYKPNERIRVTRNPDYWKPGRPYLDGIEYTIIATPATQLLAFAAGKLDFTFATIPLLKDLKSQAPQAVCDVVLDNNSRDLLINRAKPPFDKLELRQAMALSLDRQAFIDILDAGQGAVGGALLPPPDGLWGMTPEVLHTLPGYGPDVAKNREAGRALMRKLGYGPDNRLGGEADDPQYSRVIAIPQSSRSRNCARSISMPNSSWSTPPTISRASCARTTSSPSRSAPAASTSPTRNSTRTTSAAPSATSPATAIRKPTG